MAHHNQELCLLEMRSHTVMLENSTPVPLLCSTATILTCIHRLLFHPYYNSLQAKQCPKRLVITHLTVTVFLAQAQHTILFHNSLQQRCSIFPSRVKHHQRQMRLFLPVLCTMPIQLRILAVAIAVCHRIPTTMPPMCATIFSHCVH